MIRLEIVRSGHALKHKLMLGLGRFVIGATPPDILRILFHRHAFFGKPAGRLTQIILRGPSDWSVGEREFFAAFVSTRNRCRFCAVAHGAVAARALGRTGVDPTVAEGGSEDLGPKAKAILPFLEKLTLEPGRVDADDMRALKAAGISNDAIVDAAYIVALFCMYNRLVDAVGCEPMDPKQADTVSKMLLEKGYDL